MQLVAWLEKALIGIKFDPCGYTFSFNWVDCLYKITHCLHIFKKSDSIVDIIVFKILSIYIMNLRWDVPSFC